MFRFSIREMMLVTLVVAMGLGWCLHYRSMKARQEQLSESLVRSEESQSKTQRSLVSKDKQFHELLEKLKEVDVQVWRRWDGTALSVELPEGIYFKPKPPAPLITPPAF
jgi:hypothetical protein